MVFHTSSTFMDYLCGKVDNEEAQLACYYEYARESKLLRKLAEDRDGLLKARKLSCEQAVWALFERTPQLWPCGYLGIEFLMCRSFPAKDWNELSHAERRAVARFERKGVPPLPTTDVWSLKASGAFDAFKALGEKARPQFRTVRPEETAQAMKTVPPVLHSHGSLYRVLFDLDFRKTKKQLLSEFSAWLDLAENKQLLCKHNVPRVGTTGKARDRLKDLATWRLYRELGNNWNAANDFAEQNRKPSVAFHDARQGQSKKVPLTQAPLGSEQSYFLKAKSRAQSFLADYIPEEFSLPSPQGATERRWFEGLRRAVSKARKISKRSA
jgi:hypothetical protein